MRFSIRELQFLIWKLSGIRVRLFLQRGESSVMNPKIGNEEQICSAQRVQVTDGRGNGAR